MITLYNAERTLKSIYLGVLTDCLNTQINPLLTKIRQSSENVWGKEIRKNVTIENQTLQYNSTLKNLYAEIEIPERVIRAFNSGVGFVDLVNDCIESGLSGAKKSINEMLYSEMTGQDTLTGIGAIFDITKPLYGLEREVCPILTPIIKEMDEINDLVIEQTIDELAERGANIDFIAVSRKVKYAYMQYAEKHNKKLDVIELNVPKGCMYLLDTSVFTLNQLCDWRWLESDDGKILRTKSGKPNIYTATLVKYGDLICAYPNRQGLIRLKGERK